MTCIESYRKNQVIYNFCIVCVLIFTFMCLGLSYITIIINYPNKFIGTLVEANIQSSNSMYFIQEIFIKENTTDICTVNRLTQYINIRSAIENLKHVKFETTRTIYAYYDYEGLCIDDTISFYYTVIGWVSLGISAGLMIGVYIWAFIWACRQQ